MSVVTHSEMSDNGPPEVGENQMRYIVASVDAISEFGGWAINDVHSIGAVDIDSLVLDSDELILEVLHECELADLTLADVMIDGDGEELTILDTETGRPLYQLILDSVVMERRLA